MVGRARLALNFIAKEAQNKVTSSHVLYSHVASCTLRAKKFRGTLSHIILNCSEIFSLTNIEKHQKWYVAPDEITSVRGYICFLTR